MTVIALPIGSTDLILKTAADYLADYGWTPVGFYDSHTGCTERCACHRTGTYPASVIGAIRYAVFGAPRWYLDTSDGDKLHTYTAAVEWLNTYLLAVGPARMHASVFDWETTKGRNGLHVISALQHAATAYRLHTRRAA
jgi:hypothetical protein